MTVTYGATLKTNRMQLVSDLIAAKVQAASTGSATAGKLVIGTAGLSGATGVLATFNLNTNPLTIAGAVASLNAASLPLTATASASGTAALAEFRTNADVTVVSGLTVGTAGTDIILGTTTITSGGTVTITAGTITHG